MPFTRRRVEASATRFQKATTIEGRSAIPERPFSSLAAVFRKMADRAHRYRIVELATLRRIAWLCLSQEEDVLPEPEVDEDFRQRPAYQEGYLTDQPDLSVYDQWNEEEQQQDQDDEQENEDDQPF